MTGVFDENVGFWKVRFANNLGVILPEGKKEVPVQKLYRPQFLRKSNRYLFANRVESSWDLISGNMFSRGRKFSVPGRPGPHFHLNRAEIGLPKAEIGPPPSTSPLPPSQIMRQRPRNAVSRAVANARREQWPLLGIDTGSPV